MISNYNILTENDEQIIQPKDVKVELMSHQKTMIYKMLEIEDSGEIHIDKKIQLNGKSITKFIIKTSFAVLGDKVGAGKTLMISSLISIRKKIKDRDLNYGVNSNIILKINNTLEKLDTNLIIVPHKLVPQWSENFEKNISNLSVLTITTNKDIDSLIKTVIVNDKNIKEVNCFFQYEEIIPEKINIYDVIIIGETMYKRFYQLCKNFKFNRLIIDEADSINLPKYMQSNFNFMWLITGTPTGLSTQKSNYLTKFFLSIYDSNSILNDFFVFKNDDKFIEQSIVLPNPKRLKIKCLSPKELNIIKNLIPSSVLQMINAGNSEEAIKALNCNVDTNDNILQVITKNILDNIKSKEIELEIENKKVYDLCQQKEHESKVKLIENQIIKLQEKYENIKKKIYEINDSHCPVCMGELISPIITECCKSCFCFDCLAVSLGELNTNKCPNCRQIITNSDIHVISEYKENDSKIISKKYDLKDKLDVLIDLVQNKPDGSFIVFANYVETFVKIEKKLIELGISYHILKGQASVVKKNIDDFKEKKVKVLMLNAEYFGAGMNLQMTTDLVMFHRFRYEMEEQIIGRAQRLGRTTPLNIYYLLHENESEETYYNFNFEEQGSIHYMDWLENDKLNTNNVIDFNEDQLIPKNNNEEEYLIYKAPDDKDKDEDLDIFFKNIEQEYNLNFEEFEIIN